MSKNVFANGREISAKKDDNKLICAMPDTCLSPPSPPAGPLPIPYPNTVQASDTSDGSKTVKIGGDEVGLKNSSNYKKSTGDEAATKSLGMGVVTHTIQGKMKHAAWSFDVKIEGANAIRHMDLTTHNHMNCPNTMATTVDQAQQTAAPEVSPVCEELERENQNARNNELAQPTPGLTVTTRFTAPIPPAGTPSRNLIKAVSRRREVSVLPQYQNGYEPTNRKANAGCSDHQYGQDSPRSSSVENNKTRNHAEPKIMEPIFANAGNPTSSMNLGTMVMKTFHHPTSAPPDAMPCETCRPAICKVVECGLTIKLCNNNNEEVDPPCENGEPAPEAAWEALGLGQV